MRESRLFDGIAHDVQARFDFVAQCLVPTLCVGTSVSMPCVVFRRRSVRDDQGDAARRAVRSHAERAWERGLSGWKA